MAFDFREVCDTTWEPSSKQSELMGDVVEQLIMMLEDCPPWKVKACADILYGPPDYLLSYGFDGLMEDIAAGE